MSSKPAEMCKKRRVIQMCVFGEKLEEKRRFREPDQILRSPEAMSEGRQRQTGAGEGTRRRPPSGSAGGDWGSDGWDPEWAASVPMRDRGGGGEPDRHGVASAFASSIIEQVTMAATRNVREPATLHTRELPGDFESSLAESAAIIADDEQRRRWQAGHEPTAQLRLSSDMVTHGHRRAALLEMMSLTDVEDSEWCRAVLEQHGWSPQRSIAAMYADVPVVAVQEPKTMGVAAADIYYAGEWYCMLSEWMLIHLNESACMIIE